VYDGPWDNNLFKARSGFWPDADPKSSHGKSGVEGELYDPKSSHSKSGVPEADRPQKFYIPPVPEFKDVDLTEGDDYYRKEYSPYAQVLVPRPLTYAGQKLERGYYLVKLGSRWDGSQVKTLAQLQNPQDIYPNRTPTDPTVRAKDAEPFLQNIFRPKERIPAYEAMIVKKLGKVIAVFPVTRIDPVVSKKERSWKRWHGRPAKPVGRVVYDRQMNPVIQVWSGQAIYSSKVAIAP
jgi:hypothetical protein